MLCERATSPPEALLEALRRHEIEPLRCDSPFVAFARLCELSSGAPGVPVALLLVQPERLPESEALRQASERYTPASTCWVYDETSRPRLRAAPPARPRPEGLTRHEQTGQARLARASKDRRPAPKPSPKLRLVDPDTPDLGLVDPGANLEAPRGVGHSGAPSPRSILTDDELEMLMAPDLPDEPKT